MASPATPAASAPGWTGEAAGGAVAGLVAVAYALSYAALLFAGPLHALLPLGLGLCLVNAMVGAFWLSWRSQLPFAIGGPDGNTTSILAAMAAGVTLSGAGQATGTVLALLLLTTLLCAVLFLALGFGRMGRAVRYIPYPVIGGFLASTGWLIAAGALRVAVDLPGGPAMFTGVPAALADPRLWVTLVLAGGCFVLLRRRSHPAVLPGLLLGGMVVVLAGLHLAGLPPDAARAAGWLFESAPVQWAPPWQWLDAAGIDWRWLAGQWLDMLAVAAVAIITVLLGATGLEVMSRRDISLDHELRTHGWLNLLCASLGGYLSLVSVSRSAVLLESGARTRAAGMLAAGVCAVALASAGILLGWVPKVVPAAFLLYLGLAILHEWVIDSRRRLSLVDWTLIVIILGITATIGFTVAVLVGVLASCLSFAFNYSRVGVVQHDLDGTQLHSSVARPNMHRQLLALHGKGIRVLVLRGVIFFGTTSSVLDRVRSFLDVPATGRVLVLDFTHVAGADSSAALTFTKIGQLAQAAGVTLLMCGLNRETLVALSGSTVAPAAHPTLERALDTAEEALLRAHGQDPMGAQEPLAAWMLREFGDAVHCERLMPLLQRQVLGAGGVLMTQGDPSNGELYLIETGRLGVTLRGQNLGQRLASLMGGNIVGEMALYSSAPRSATVTAETDTVVWTLTRHALEGLHLQAPDTAMQFHAFVMRTMAERVRLANGTIAALQRGA
ncbi:MAG: cyclic nucleotide-binding domain-containing protein [Proteobacteria bacterium]|nr:cyclic nucleotide-binding domain-containing protein [Pseudomonadota bacterium]